MDVQGEEVIARGVKVVPLERLLRCGAGGEEGIARGAKVVSGAAGTRNKSQEGEKWRR